MSLPQQMLSFAFKSMSKAPIEPTPSISMHYVCWPNIQITAVRSWYGAPYDQKVVVRIHADDLQVAGRYFLVAVPASHALSLEHTRGRGVHARAAAVTVNFLYAVCGALTLEVVPHHYAGGASAFGIAGYIHGPTVGKQLDGE